MHAGDPTVISIQPLIDMEHQLRSSEAYEEVRLVESNEELKMDLAGYVGDFHRHRVDNDIKKRVAMTEGELIAMMLESDRMKEINLAFREIDPDKNGYLTQ